MKTALVIMAAGIGSRFGQGIKQMEPLGPSGEIIIDYSIHDAIEAGFDKVVFIIRHDLEKDFKEVIGDRIAKKIEVEYAFQEKENVPDWFDIGERTKPWGTGQAILATKGIVKEPFAVINADDYYGKEGFRIVHDWLVSGASETTDKRHFCMAGFELTNTLSENGGVTRGVCKADDSGYLTEILETENIEKINGKAAVRADDGTPNYYPDGTLVSMNMWGINPDFIEEVLEPGFKNFLREIPEGNIKKEYLLPMVIGELVEKGEADVKILPTPDKWFGVTYQEDKYYVRDAFKALVAQGIYPENIKD
ncbi:MAG: nucleotidyltransferase [Clostridia bacterium]|nr:nucleotidyltransferase [Clostridia bacterium]MBR6512884.1 nucleotidyltransferase [Clostridia bacterium]